MHPTLSIVIPVWNSKDKLLRCLNSIMVQSPYFERTEVIIVDDGSSDDTVSECEKVISAYDNISLICSSHKGVVYARKTGIEVAGGEFIWFIDSDDYIANDALGIIYERINQYSTCDIFMFKHYIDNGQSKIEQHQLIKPGFYDRNRIENEIEPYEFHDFTQKIYRKPIVDGFLWNKIFRRTLLCGNYFFDEEVSLFEDVVTVCQCINNAGNILFFEDYLYFYDKSEESATSHHRDDYFKNTYLVGKYLKDTFDKKYQMGVSAFVTERLIVSITHEARFGYGRKKSVKFIRDEMKKYPIISLTSVKWLPFFIKAYLLFVRLGFWNIVYEISKMKI